MDLDETDDLQARRYPRRGPLPATQARDRIVAVVLALLVNAWAGALLLRAPAPLREDVADAPLEVVWIEQATPRPAAVPAVRERPIHDAARASPPDPALHAIAPLHDAPGPAETVKATASAASNEGPFPTMSGASTHDDLARRGVFAPRPVDPFSRQDDGPFRMRDTSLGGRLQRLARRADCAELRSRLRGYGENQAAILRAMSERRCS